MHRHTRFALILLPVALAACGKKDDTANLDTLDNQLTNGSAKDPALAGALGDQIMVDPQLSKQANNDAIRPATQPVNGETPPDAVRAPADATPSGDQTAPAPTKGTGSGGATTLGALAARQGSSVQDCGPKVAYSAQWAAKLPAALPVYPDGHVTEAAGTNDGGCALRVVSFTSTASVNNVLNWYFSKAKAAGYSAGHQVDGQEHMLAGNRNKDGATFVLYVRPHAGGGSEADLVVNHG